MYLKINCESVLSMNKIFKYSHLVLVFALSLWPQQGLTSQVLDQLDRNTTKTASHVMLDHLYSGPADAKQSEKIFDVAAPKLTPRVKLTMKDALLVESIMAQEKEHADKYVVYHGLNPQVWYCLRVLSNLRHMLDEKNDTQTTMLRSLDMFFTRFPTAAKLMEGKQSDTDLSYKLAGLCCNPTLLSWLDRNDECTLEFFLRAYSMAPPTDPWSTIELFLKEAELSDTNILEAIKGIYAKEFENKNVGCLLQIFLNPEIIDDICFPSVDFGRDLRNLQGEAITSAKYALDRLRAGHLDSATPLEKIQIRLHADLARFKDKVRVIDHFTDGNHGRLVQLDNDIRSAFRSHLGGALNGLLLKDYVFSSGTPALLQKARNEKGVPPQSITRAHSSITCEFSGPMEYLRRAYENPLIMEDESELNKVCYFIGSSSVRPIKDIPLINLILTNKDIFQNRHYLDLLMGFLNKNYDAKCYMDAGNILLLEGTFNFLVQGVKEGFIVDNMSREYYSCVMKTLIEASHEGEAKVNNAISGIQTFKRAIAHKSLQWEEGSDKDFGSILFYLGLIGDGSEAILSELVQPEITISQLKELIIQAYNKTNKAEPNMSALDDFFN